MMLFQLVLNRNHKYNFVNIGKLYNPSFKLIFINKNHKAHQEHPTAFNCI